MLTVHPSDGYRLKYAGPHECHATAAVVIKQLKDVHATLKTHQKTRRRQADKQVDIQI